MTVTKASVKQDKQIDLPTSGYVRMRALIAPHGPIPACRSTLYAWIQAGIFPAPVAIGPGRIKGFRVEDVRAFLAQPSATSLRPEPARQQAA